MNDLVIQLEVSLNFLNTLFSKAMYYNDTKAVNNLCSLRKSIYYEDNFVYEIILKKLQETEIELRQYD